VTANDERRDFLAALELPPGGRLVEVTDDAPAGSEGSCDAILCIDRIAHVRDRGEMLIAWARALKPGGRVLYTDPAIVGGLITSDEIAARSGGGLLVLAPQGENEGLIEAAGLWLLRADDATEALALSASTRLRERAGREAELVQSEGRERFDVQQRCLQATSRMASERRLARIAFLAKKPA